MIIKNKKILNLIIVVALLVMFLPVVTYGASGSSSQRGLMEIVREIVAEWYFIFRYFSIALMLIILIVLGIKVAISSIAEEKAKYKRMLVDWVVGFIIIFTIHYFMLFILTINEKCIKIIEDISGHLAERWVTAEEANLGLKPSTQGLYEMVRTRAYELRFSIGTSGMIMYMVLIYYTIKFVLIYFKRFFTILILTIMAPIMGLMYALNKILSGKAITLKKWASEYAFNVFLQTIHALVYGIFVQLAVGLSTQSIAGFILAMVMLNFISKAEQLMRKILKLAGGLVDDNANKGIKENLAAMTAMKASIGTVFGSQIAKDVGSGVKNLVGGAATLGARSGMVAYDKGVDALLDYKKKQKEAEEKRLEEEKFNNIKSSKEKLQKEKEIKERIAKLDNSIKKLEKTQETKNTRLEGYRGGIQDSEKLQEYIDEKTKGIYDPELKRKEEQRLREENKNKILKRVKTKNKYTGQVEISGVGTKIKNEINTAIWGNDAIKSGTKDLLKTTATGLAGMFMTIASVPMIVTEPAVGLALLAKGRQNAKKLFSNDEYRKATNLSERNAIRAGQRKIRKRQNEEIKKIKKERKTLKKQRKALSKPVNKEKGRKLSFNRFNARSLETIKSQAKMDANLNAIRKINSLSLGSLALTAPFRFTGTLGAVRTIQSKAYKIQEARKDYYENLETFTTLEKKDSISKDFVLDYNLKVDGIKKAVEAKSDFAVIEKFNEDSGKVITVGNNKFQFGQPIKVPSNPIEIKAQIIDNVLLNVAAKNKVLDIKDLNLKSNKIQTQLVEEFRKVGVLDDTIIPEEFKIDKTLKLNLDKLENRVQIIAKENPKAVEETIAKEVIVDYMERNKIEDASEIKKEEHKEKIKQEILEIIEEKEEFKPFEQSETKPKQTIDISELIFTSTETLEKDNKEEPVNQTELKEITNDFKEKIVEVLDKKDAEEIINELEDKILSPIENKNVEEIVNELEDKILELSENKQTKEIINDFKEKIIGLSENKEINKILKDIKSETKSEKIYNKSLEETQEIKLQDYDFMKKRLESTINVQEKKVQKEERLDLFENLINSMKKSDTIRIEDMLENEVIAEERKRQIEIEKDKLDSQLEGFEEIINKDIDDSKAIEDYIENETSPEVDELLAQLLALKEQDMAGIALKFKPNSYEQKRMNTIDLDRINSTYKKKI